MKHNIKDFGLSAEQLERKYGFDDGSAVYTSGAVCREATPEEIAEYK